jgi:hypothetical protein
MASPTTTLSGDAALTYRFGAGWLPSPNNVIPAAFKSLPELLAFWEIHGPTQLSGIGGAGPTRFTR